MPFLRRHKHPVPRCVHCHVAGGAPVTLMTWSSGPFLSNSERTLISFEEGRPLEWGQNWPDHGSLYKGQIAPYLWPSHLCEINLLPKTLVELDKGEYLSHFLEILSARLVCDSLSLACDLLGHLFGAVMSV